jgi:hypothetical protein
MANPESVSDFETATAEQCKPAISERKLAANRRNAQRSTGPRTARGKNTSRYNAINHGMLVKAAVIPSGPAREDTREYKRLLEELREQYKPMGLLEDLALQEILVCYCRLARTLRYERGEITSNIDIAREGYAEGESAHVSPDQRRFFNWLKSAQRAVKREGSIPQFLKGELLALRGVPDMEEFEERLLVASTPTFRGAPEEESRADIKRRLLILLSEYKEALAEAIDEEKENLEFVQSLAAFPDGRALDKILRYQAALERQLQRAIGVLLLLQSQRQRATAQEQADSAERTQQVV